MQKLWFITSVLTPKCVLYLGCNKWLLNAALAAGNPRQPMPFGLAYNLLDYIELLDWTGRQKAHSWGQVLHLPHCIACRALRDRESENFAHM